MSLVASLKYCVNHRHCRLAFGSLVNKFTTIFPSPPSCDPSRSCLVYSLHQAIYPINIKEKSGEYCIRGLDLPADLYSIDDEKISSALGYTAHLVCMLAKYLQVPLRYQVIYNASRCVRNRRRLLCRTVSWLELFSLHLPVLSALDSWKLLCTFECGPEYRLHPSRICSRLMRVYLVACAILGGARTMRLYAHVSS